MSFTYSGQFDDVTNDGYLSINLSVTSSAVEAKVGASRQAGREWISITNKGAKTVYYGPSGVTSTTGDVLYKDQTVVLPFGDNVGIFVICGAGDTATVIVQEGA